MTEQTTRQESGLVAELNDLLQLDHDAVQAYTVAIEKLAHAGWRETLLHFRSDHERHIEDLSRAIREHGGEPLELAHVPSGFFKLAVQRVGAAGGDRALLLAFKANERQVRDKYRRHAEREHPAEITEMLRRGAGDEERHYGWAADTLEEIGAGSESALGRMEYGFEVGHKAAADAMERAGRMAMQTAEYLRRKDYEGLQQDLRERVDEKPMRTVLLALAAGFVVGRLLP